MNTKLTFLEIADVQYGLLLQIQQYESFSNSAIELGMDNTFNLERIERITKLRDRLLNEANKALEDLCK
jgi:hypothetical protein